MCGIAGFVHTAGAADAGGLEALARRMGDRLRHRGPDDSGAWADAAAGVALAHRRLSIVDLSAGGHQPMHSGCGRYVVSFNGEIYNFRELREELAGAGHRFRGQSDTEVMLAAFTRWGVEGALGRLNGMFAFAVWDRRERVLHLVRDRMGKKPLYYGWAGRTFLFGSEMKALGAHPAFDAAVDRGSLALFLRLGYIPAPYSIYRGIRKLAAGTRVAVDPRRAGEEPAPVAYWSAREAAERGVAEPFRGTPAAALDKLDALLRDAAGRRMIADVPLGAFLSGGIDSSLVVALMQAQSGRPVRTFSIGFDDEAYNEARYAKAVARHLGTDHTELYLRPADALAVIPRLPQWYDEPFADASQVPTFLVSEMARRHVTVCLSGDGGDELFGGYRTYLSGRQLNRRIAWIPRPARAALAALLAPLPGPAKLVKLRRVLPFESPGELYRELQADWEPPLRVPGAGDEPPTVYTDPARRAALPNLIHHMMYIDTVTYLPDDILAKVDRASMAVSLEVRAPLLDYRVAEFAWRLPLAWKIRDGQGKWILRRLLDRYVPRPLVERPKAGFTLPFGEWLRGPLREWAEELLDERRLRSEGFLDAAEVRRAWREHATGERDRKWRLWSVLMFQAWQEAAREPAHA